MLEKKQINRRRFMGASLMTLCLSANAFSDQQSDVVLRFAVMSDVHFSGEPDAPEVQRLKRALDFMYEYSAKEPYNKFDALLVAGDMTNHGYRNELDLFKKTLDDGIRPGTSQLLCMGNHEFHYNRKKDLWRDIFKVKPNDVYKVNGYHFIALSPDRGSNSNGDYRYALDWMKRSLEDASAADPDKPIFVFQHYHISDTVYGSCGDDHWGIADLDELFRKYPNVIDFSGHSHYPINDPKSAWQGQYTAFGTGTLSYFEMAGGVYEKFPEGYRNAAQFYIVEVHRDNSVVLKPYDLITDSFFDLVYLVADPGNASKYLYTEKRYKDSIAPHWETKTIPTVGEVLDHEATVVIPQAVRSSKNDIVHSYRFHLEKKVNGSWVTAPDRYVWSEYYFNKKSKDLTALIEGLEDQTEYRAKITAINAFNKESSDFLTTEFKTVRDLLDTVDKNAPKPNANILDISFTETEAVNNPVNGLKNQKKLLKNGDPKIIADPVSGTYTAVFDGKNDYYKIPFTKKEYRRFSDSVTMALKFKTDSFRNAAQDIFANTEGGGCSFAINSKEKKLEFWCSAGGGYKIVSADFEPGKYITAFGVYDGKNIILYLNGKEVARKAARGSIRYTGDKTAMAFCLGSDIAHGGGGSGFFKGTIAWAKLFNWALTPEQVAHW